MGDCTCPRLNSIDPERPILSAENVHELMISTYNCTEGTTVTVFCNESYELEGDETFTCRANGKWNYQQEPKCVKQTCPSVTSLSNIVVSTDSRKLGTRLTVTCVDGYTLHGDSTFTCTSEGWDFTTQPSCRAGAVNPDTAAGQTTGTFDTNTKILLGIGITLSVVMVAAVAVFLVRALCMKKRKKMNDSIDGSIFGINPQQSYRSSFRERSDIFAPESMEMSGPPPSYHSNPVFGLYSNYPLAYHDRNPYTQSVSGSISPFQLPRLRPATKEDEGRLRPLAGLLEEESPWPQIARPEIGQPLPLSHPLRGIPEEDDPYFLPDHLPDEPIRSIDRRVQRNYRDEYSVYRGSPLEPASRYQSLPGGVQPRDSYRRALHPREAGVHTRDSYRRAVHPSEAPPSGPPFRGTYPRDRF